MQDFDVYIPQDRRFALAHGLELPDRTFGAALFADISGFTPLAEALAQELGPQRGAEELTAHLNRLYDALIHCVHQFGGSVIGFSGDAITCWFAAKQKGSNQAVTQAVACGLAMQQAMSSQGPITTGSGATFTLAVKVAVASGAARRFLVGDPHIQVLDVLAGCTLDRLAMAGRLAQRGEVVLDAQTATSLTGHVHVSGWRGGETEQHVAIVDALSQAPDVTPWPDVVAQTVPAEQANVWLLPSVRERLRRQSATFLAELRPVVALMLHFQGIDYDHDPAAGQRLNTFVCAAQQIATHYEGALIDITMGDKGSYLYLTFGAPVAHDDDAARALAAALDLLALPCDMPYVTAVRIGLARGTMHAGAYGGTQRRTYGVLGDPANLAARLMEAAPDGTAWCDYAVYHAAERRWAFAALPPVRVKGKASAIRVYEPLNERDQHVATPDVQRTMVGRHAEIAQLAAQLDDVAAGASRMFIVEGEAGIGKSRMVAELVQLLRARGMVGLLGAGKSVEQQTPYRAWRDIFSAYFGLDELADPEERQARVQTYMAEHLPHLADRLPILNDVLSLDLPETDVTRGFGPRLRSENLGSMLVELLRVWISAQPLVVVLEDAHWLDSLSWELAVRLAQTAGAEHLPLFLMVTTRPIESTHQALSSLTMLLRHAGATHLKLGQLSPGDTVALAAARLGIDAAAMPDELTKLVQKQSGGNPFFAEELVTTLQEQEIIQVKAADDSPTPHMRCSIIGNLAQASSHMPDTLQGLLLARIDRLPPEQQLMLKVASVIGPVFDYPPLQHVHRQHVALDDSALKSSLRVLAARDFTQLEAPEPQLAYRFKHVLTQEAAYQTLLYTQRRALHRSAAEWYETTYAMQPSETLAPWHTLTGRQSEVVYVLAHHYRHAEDAERERHYVWLAGIHAADQFANTEAFAYFTRALELTPEHDFATRYDILFEREAIEELLGMREAQARDLELLQELADALADTRRRADVARNRARFSERVGNIAESRAFAVQAIALAETAGATKIAIRAYDQLTWACIRAGNYDEARVYAEAGLRIARASGDRSDEAQMLTALGCVYAEVEQYDMARLYLSQSQHIFHELNRHRGESVALGNLGEVMMLQGDYAAAQNHIERALHLYRVTGDLRNEGWMLGNLGTSARHLGDYAAARTYYTEALSKSRAVEDRNTESAIMVDLAVLMHQTGNHSEALEQGTHALRRAVSKTVETRSLIVVGHALAGMGRLDEAHGYYTDALTLAQESGLHAKAIEAEAGLARVALAAENVADAGAQVAHILARADLAPLAGTDEPFRMHLTCYQVLMAAHDERALDVLAAAHRLLMERAAKIDNEALRQSFLEQVPYHREIVAAWQEQGSMRCAVS